MRIAAIVCTLAWRNLWRNHRRTLIMLAAIAVGVWAMLFMTALMRGMVNEMVRDGIRALPGHVQIHHPGFRDDPSVDKLMPPPAADLLVVLGGKDVVAWASRVKVPAVITSERDSRGVTLIGIAPDEERGLSFLADAIAEGRFLDSVDDTGIIVGRKMVDNLETRLGKRIVVMSQDPDNEIVDRGFRIVGIFEASIASYEEQMIFSGRGTVQRMLRIDDQVSEIAILGEDYRAVDSLRDAIAAIAGEGRAVQPWYTLNKYLSTMLGVMDGFVLIWMIVVFLALSFGLVNTLVMAVFERIREIGLMLALGMKPVMILGQFVVESLCLLVMGLVSGNLLAIATIATLSSGIDVSVVAEGMEMFGAGSVLHPELTLTDVIRANVIVIGLGFLASLAPAWRASRYQPIEAITRV